MHCNSSSSDTLEEEEEEVGKKCSGTEVGCKSSSPPFSFKRYGIRFFFFFCILQSKKRLKKDKKRLVCLRVVEDVITLTTGLQGWACESDLRQHVKLQGLPQQWNCRWLIDRLLKTQPVQIASHFHAPALLTLHQGGRRPAGGEVCVCVRRYTLDSLGKRMSLSQSSAHVRRFTHTDIHTHICK